MAECTSVHREIGILRDMADGLRFNKWPASCQENVEAAMVYLDCATQNLIESQAPNPPPDDDDDIGELTEKNANAGVIGAL